ncbi:hypothetical protein [Streptomyces sp. NPDC059893]|uniref:hypothetical protein n=1 Tax=Streptomyces sp. NPDC059893 TaxID=3346990 RepID=UPI00364A8E71
MTAQINRSVKVTAHFTGVATLTIEGHEQGDLEYPKSLSVILCRTASDGRAAPPSGFLWGACDAS